MPVRGTRAGTDHDRLEFERAHVAMVSFASADDSREASSNRPEEVTTYRFEDDLVQGDLLRPDGEVLRVRRRRAAGSLIRVREHFIDQLLKTAENL